MKRIIAFLLCLCMILCGCGAKSTSETTPVSATEPIETTLPAYTISSTEPVAVGGVTIEESVVFDNGDFKLTAKEIDFSDNFYVKVKFLAENNTDKNVSIVGSYFSINGITMYCSFYIEVAAGKKANDYLEIRRDSLKAVGIEEIATIVAQDSYIYDKDISRKILDFRFEISTSVANGYQQEIDRSGQTIYDQNGVVVKYRGVIPGQYSGEELEFYVENSTDSNLTIHVDNVSVNGFMIYGSLVAHAYPGCVTYETLSFSSTDMEENDIESIEEVSFNLYGYDQETSKKVWTSNVITLGRTASDVHLNEIPDSTIEESTSTNQEITISTEPAINVAPSSTSIDSLAASVTSILKNNYEHCDVSYDETGLTADISADGLASICSLAYSGNSKMKENWNTVVDNITALSNSITEVFESHGYDNYMVNVNIMNDQNPDNIILMTVNGIVVYNAAE